MKIRADYHTHTFYSDGKSTIEDNVRSAVQKGLQVVGISDHGWGHAFYGIKKEKRHEIFAEIERLQQIYPQIRVMKAIEANILGPSGKIDLTPEDMKDYDIVLAGYHFGSKPASASDVLSHLINYMNRLFGLFKKTAVRRNTDSLIVAMRDYPFQVLTHPGDKGPVDIVRIAEAAIKYNKILEVNKRHHHMTVEQLRLIRDMDVKILISSDAHTTQDIGEVQECIDRLKQADFDLRKVINLEEEA